MRKHAPSAGFHTRPVLSSLPVTTRPSEVAATAYTSAVCPTNTVAVSPPCVHNRAVQSCDAERNPTPGMAARPRTVSECPRRIATGLPASPSPSHRRMVWSAEPERNPPEGSGRRARTEDSCASRVRTHARVSRDQILTRLSMAPETTAPEARTATAVTSRSWPANSTTGAPVLGSQTMTRLSREPETSAPAGRDGMAPGGAYARVVTKEE